MALETGRVSGGLRYASVCCWRLVAYANGGYARQQWHPRLGWILFRERDSIPRDIEKTLCQALGIEYQG